MKLKKLLNEENQLTVKKYKWTAIKDGTPIKSGVREITNQELIDQFQTTNLANLVDKWNRQGQVKTSKSNGLTWKYELI